MGQFRSQRVESVITADTRRGRSGVGENMGNNSGHVIFFLCIPLGFPSFAFASASIEATFEEAKQYDISFHAFERSQI